MNRQPIFNEASRQKQAQTNVIILCGGLGTRLRAAVPDCPKVLASVQDTAFLDILLAYVKDQGFSRIILSIGYRGDMVKAHLKNDTSLLFSEEDRPLGTGGALKKAFKFVHSEHCLVMNGDTFCPVDLFRLVNFHEQKKAVISMVLGTYNRPDAGGVTIDTEKRIRSFQEKTARGFLNAGIYVFKQSAIDFLPAGDIFSLENDVFPSFIQKHPCFGWVTEEDVIDIGTSDRYVFAQRQLIKYLPT